MTKKKENKQICCEVIQDLMPLYHDHVVSEKTREIVQKHLEECEVCRKEYDAMCAELPIEAVEQTTKGKFMDMLGQYKRKQLIRTIIAAVMAGVIIIVTYFLQLQFPVVNVSDNKINVERVYRYKTDEGDKFFVLYSAPLYENSVNKASIEKGEIGSKLVLDIKKPLIAKSGLEAGDIWVYECPKHFEEVEFGGNIVWKSAEDTEDEIPEYVYAYEEYISGKSDVKYWNTSIENGYLEAGYDSGEIIRWDLYGNVLFVGDSN